MSHHQGLICLGFTQTNGTSNQEAGVSLMATTGFQALCAAKDMRARAFALHVSFWRANGKL